MSVLPYNQSKQAAPFGRRTGLAAGLCLRRYGAAICERLTTKGGLRHWEEERENFASGFRDSIEEWCFK